MAVTASLDGMMAADDDGTDADATAAAYDACGSNDREDAAAAVVVDGDGTEFEATEPCLMLLIDI